MALKRPPSHRLDHVPIFISQTDSAWDRDRIEAELKDLGKEARFDHPVIRYYEGKTRYDLRADNLREYLVDDSYWVFELARLSTAHMAELFDLRSVGKSTQHLDAAAKLGVSEVRNAGDFQLTFSGARLSEETASELLRAYPAQIGVTGDIVPSLLYELGDAVWKLSARLDDAEKKR